MSQRFKQWVAEVFAGLVPLPPPTSPPLTPIVGFPPVHDPGDTPADDGDDPLRDVVQLFGDAATTMVDAGTDVMSTIEGIFDDLGAAIGEIPFDAFINGIEGVAPERVLAAKREAEAFERENDISMQSLANMLAGFAAQPGALESLQGFAAEVMSDPEIAANLANNLGPFQEPLRGCRRSSRWSG